MLLNPSRFTLYSDQESSVAQLLDKVEGGAKRLLFIGATGCGKTAISAELKRQLHPRKMLFVVHRDILIEQTIATLRKSGFPLETIGVIAGRYRENRDASIQILSIQTAPRRSLDWFRWEVLFFDEAHTTGWSNWALKTHAQNPDRIIIYLTATPWRLSKKQSFLSLVDEDDYVFAPLPAELIKMGRLVKPIYYKALEVKLDGVKTSKGDFDKGDLNIVCNNPDVIAAGLKFWQERYPGERTIAFAVSVEHGKLITDMAIAAGRKAVLIHGETPIPERNRHYKALQHHRIDLIVSVDCLSEGFDVPNIRCVWLLRPSMSRSKVYQQIGRGLRTAEGKTDCIVLDQSGNLTIHPLIEDLDQEDFIERPEKPKPALDMEPRICIERDLKSWEKIWDGDGCHAIIGTKVKICPHCGYELPVRIDDKAIAIGEVVEVIPESEKPAPVLSEQQKKEIFISTMDMVFANKWHPAAARFRFKESVGHTPPQDYFWRWVRYRDKSPQQITAWLTAVDKKKGTGQQTLTTWLKKLTPPDQAKISA